MFIVTVHESYWQKRRCGLASGATPPEWAQGVGTNEPLLGTGCFDGPRGVNRAAALGARLPSGLLCGRGTQRHADRDRRPRCWMEKPAEDPDGEKRASRFRAASVPSEDGLREIGGGRVAGAVARVQYPAGKRFVELECFSGGCRTD